MAKEKKERLFELPETKGIFQTCGIVSGVAKENFYQEKKTSTRRDLRIANFGITYDKNSNLYVHMQGMAQDNVYFGKQVKEGEKSDTIAVPWANRHTFRKENYRLIGNNIGVKKVTDEKGNQVNDKKYLTDFDACKEISENLKDGQSVFVKGKIEVSSYQDDKGNQKRSVKLAPNQVSLCKDVEFDNEDFVAQNEFKQVIVFVKIEQEKLDDKPTGRFVLSAKIINYATIEDMEFYITDSSLATILKKNLKPYNSIEVSGKIVSKESKEEVDDDIWGEKSTMDKVNAPTVREFVITGAKKSSLDVKTYSESAIELALGRIHAEKNAKADYADKDSNDGWGNGEDEETPW